MTVRLENVELRYHSTALFSGLDLTLAGGRWTCLLGQSGVGKSSLLRYIAGLLPAASGRIVCNDAQPLAGRVAYMAQHDLLLPWLPVLENVCLGARLRQQAQPTRRARELLEQVGLTALQDRLPHTLSGGQRQRVALARTLLENRPLTLMDEPFANLDAITRYRLQALAAKLLAGRSVLLVTHDPLEALRLGHSVRVMAGQPARLLEPIEPPGQPPRGLGDPVLLGLHGELLERLA